ncbi:hypothetical protein Cgig2_034163 [Carnegiea gigantea]|uniref:Uncharacterized protein n=1 Tax=Carnegiea gigantea TaxID=171969 RepID=A0A9Q1JTU1_9CARY|nr:hypothetical protein Cgig2_034163 [Carnegiea gigantea]
MPIFKIHCSCIFQVVLDSLDCKRNLLVRTIIDVGEEIKSILYIPSAYEIEKHLEKRFSTSNGARKYKLCKDVYAVKQNRAHILNTLSVATKGILKRNVGKFLATLTGIIKLRSSHKRKNAKNQSGFKSKPREHQGKVVNQVEFTSPTVSSGQGYALTQH